MKRKMPSTRNRHADYAADETRLFDYPPLSPLPASDANGTDDMDHHCGKQVFTDADETQAVTFDGETQAVTFDSETQIFTLDSETQDVEYGGETQEVDFAVDTVEVDIPHETEIQLHDGFENEVCADTDDEGTDITEIVDNTHQPFNGLSPMGRNGSLSIEGKVERHITFVDELDSSPELLNDSIRRRSNSGIELSTATTIYQDIPRRKNAKFTSVRTAAFRASGLAARGTCMMGALNCCVPQKGAGCELCHTPLKDDHFGLGTVEDSSLGQYASEEVDQLLVARGSDVRTNGLRVENKAIRKLFAEDSPFESMETSYDCQSNGACDFSHPVSSDDEISGLSYVNSQEPGEASQANALKIVQSFVENMLLETKSGVESKKLTQTTCVKGVQSLAKKLSSRDRAEVRNVFEWYDDREDEGGGDILSRRKEEIFGSERQSKKDSKKVKVPCMVNNLELDEPAHATNKKLIEPDSTIMPHKIVENEKKLQASDVVAQNNFGNSIECMMNGNELIEKPKENCEKPDIYEEWDVGSDTQIAAEAMEALLHVDGMRCLNANGIHKDVQFPDPGSSRGKDLSSVEGKSAPCQKFRSPRFMEHNVENCSPGDFMLGTRSKTRSSSEKRKNEESIGIPIITSGKKRKCIPVGRLEEPKKVKRRFIDRKQLKAWLQNSLSARKRKHDSPLGPVAQEKCHSLHGHVEQDPLRGGQTEEPRQATLGGINLAAKQCGLLEEVDAQKKLSELPNQSIQPSEINPHLVAVAGTYAVQSFPKRRRSKSRNAVDKNKTMMVADLLTADLMKKNKIDTFSSLVGKEQERTPRGKEKHVTSACNTPVNCKTPVNSVSPVCVGDGYNRFSNEKLVRSGLMNELRNLTARTVVSFVEKKTCRRRRNLGSIRILFSHHLDEDVCKQQKKILAKLGILEASSMTDATHFVAEQFVRTRNMLEAIASGKPVVTPLWLLSIGQVNTYIDEESYILRDNKKERELGFSMPISLSCARKHPLLKGKNVFVTPNAKPSRETISSLVKAVHGQAVGRVGRSAMMNDKLGDLLIISCEEDYPICVPFLEKGACVYSSELVLSGIVTQKLEYDRYQLFVDQVKKTRAAMRIRKADGKFHVV